MLVSARRRATRRTGPGTSSRLFALSFGRLYGVAVRLCSMKASLQENVAPKRTSPTLEEFARPRLREAVRLPNSTRLAAMHPRARCERGQPARRACGREESGVKT